MLLYLLNQYLLYAYCIVFKQTAFNQPAFIKHLLYMPVFIPLVFIGHSLCCSVSKSCPALYDPMNYSSPGFPVLHYLLEFAQTHVYWVSDPTTPSSVAPLSSCPQSSPASVSFPMSQLYLMTIIYYISLYFYLPSIYWAFTVYSYLFRQYSLYVYCIVFYLIKQHLSN